METALVYHPTLSSDVWRSRPEDDLPLICLFFFRFLFLSVHFTASFVWKSLPFGPRSTAIHWFIDLLSTTLHGRCSQPNLPATTSLIHLVRRRSYRTALRRRRDQDGTKGKGIKKKERSKLKHKKGRDQKRTLKVKRSRLLPRDEGIRFGNIEFDFAECIVSYNHYGLIRARVLLASIAFCLLLSLGRCA